MHAVHTHSEYEENVNEPQENVVANIVPRIVTMFKLFPFFKFALTVCSKMRDHFENQELSYLKTKQHKNCYNW